MAGAFPSPLYRGLSDDVDGVVLVVGGIGLTTAMTLIERYMASQRPWCLILVAREPVHLVLASRFLAAAAAQARRSQGEVASLAPWLVRAHYTGSEPLHDNQVGQTRPPSSWCDVSWCLATLVRLR